MIKIVDFTNCPLSSRNLEYGGRAGEKKGILYKDEFWFLKYPKNTRGMRNIEGLSYVTSPLSEFIGSQIFEILGYDVHKTILGICDDGGIKKVVCACKDFIKDDKNEILIPYTALKNEASGELLNRESKPLEASNINEIIYQLDHNTALKSVKGVKERFWDMVLIDVLINNNDRNEDNWGVIKNKINNSYQMAPIYDCGNCFYSKTSDERVESILADLDRLKQSSLNCITAYESDGGIEISISDIFKIKNKDLNETIIRVSDKVYEKLGQIEELIDSIPESYNGIEIMSDARKKYYLESFKNRYFLLLRAHAYVLSLKKKKK